MRPFNILTLVALTSIAASSAWAQIRALTLPEMIERSDHAVDGEIVASRVARIRVAGEEEFFYYTTLTIEGQWLGEGTDVTVDVSFPGGFVSEEEGVWNSESPTSDEVAVGNRIVAFYTWHAGIGGVHEANWLHANHGGLYRTVDGPKGAVVLGRGEGYAVSRNRTLSDLGAAVARIREEIRQREQDR